MIPSSELLEETSGEVTFTLPLKFIDSFSSLFKALESKAKKLKIGSFGVTLTTLEQVFLQLGEEKHKTNGKDEDIRVEVSNRERSFATHIFFQKVEEPETVVPDFDPPTEPATFVAQVTSLSYVKYRQFVRTPLSIICGVVIPGSFIICVLLFLCLHVKVSTALTIPVL